MQIVRADMVDWWRRQDLDISRFSPQVFMSRELKLRIVSALVLAGIVLQLTWLGGWSFAVLWSIAAFAILYEFTRICEASISPQLRIASLVVVSLVAASWIFIDAAFAVYLFIASVIVFALREGFSRKTIWSSVGIAYAGLPFFAMLGLRGDAQNSVLAVFVLFACVWGADIFAYVAGKSIGGPKLAPIISPNKTWSGFLGSLAGAIGLSLIVILVAGYQATFAFFGIVLFLAVVSQIGDLAESSLKRRFNVKDSGDIIPGHGGLLDRIDGLIFAAVAFWIILLFVRGSGGDAGNLPLVFIDNFLTL